MRFCFINCAYDVLENFGLIRHGLILLSVRNGARVFNSRPSGLSFQLCHVVIMELGLFACRDCMRKSFDHVRVGGLLRVRKVIVPLCGQLVCIRFADDAFSIKMSANVRVRPKPESFTGLQFVARLFHDEGDKVGAKHPPGRREMEIEKAAGLFVLLCGLLFFRGLLLGLLCYCLRFHL